MNERPKWTGDAVAMMHVNRITHQELADRIGWSRNYLYRILDGKDTPQKARKKVIDAISAIKYDRVKRKEEKNGREEMQH